MKKLTSSQIEAICTRYRGGESSEVLAVAFGVSSVAIRGLLIRRNVPRRNASECARQYRCNHEYFADIQTEGQAYWLGFLAADGTITERNGGNVILSLASRDRDHVTRFARALSSNHPVHDRQYRTCSFVTISIASPQMTSDLARYGVTPRKTATLIFPDLPQHLEQHYIRGYVDGDGGFTISRSGYPSPNVTFHVIGNPSFIRQMQSVLIRECNLRETMLYQRRPGQPVSQMRYCGKAQTACIANYLYENAAVFLPRKHHTITSYLNGAKNIAAKYRASVGTSDAGGQPVNLPIVGGGHQGAPPARKPPAIAGGG
jgi:hypothetical protein